MPEIPQGHNNPVRVNRNSFGNENGQPLPQSFKHEMEASFGADLSNVRVHESHAATHLKAKAFSDGNDIFFGPGKYDPHSNEGQQLLAHELAHTIQQKGGVNPEAVERAANNDGNNNE